MDPKSGSEVGMQAPDFTLRDGSGSSWNLAEHRGKVVVLLFYPGDETPVCTRQLCSVRDRWEDYMATGAEVVGVSTGSMDSHKNFAEHHNLPLRLLSDVGAKVASSYDSRSIFPGRVARSVFVIDRDGIIRYRDVRRVGLFRPNDDQIIKAIRATQSG
jgi:peroxiredoxin Q/BCP